MENKIEVPKFESAREMVNWLMINEGYLLCDNYGRHWIYENYQFAFKDINGGYTDVLRCLHLFSTELFTIKK